MYNTNLGQWLRNEDYVVYGTRWDFVSGFIHEIRHSLLTKPYSTGQGKQKLIVTWNETFTVLPSHTVLAKVNNSCLSA